MLNEKLRNLRETKGLTQSDIAQKLKITREAYSMYETNKRQMNHESLCILADFFGVTTDYLLGRSEEDIFIFSEDEKSIIEKYRKLDERGKKNISGILDMEYARFN